MRPRSHEHEGPRHAPPRAAAILVLAAVLAALPAPAGAQPGGRFAAPLHALAGDRVPIRITFQDGSGAPLIERVAFQLVVTGQAFFLEPAREGSIRRGGGTSYVVAETTTGAFECDLEVPAVEALDFLFLEDTEHGLAALQRTLLADQAEGLRPRWQPRTLGGPAASWTRTAAPPDAGGGPPRGKAWWNGPRVAARDSALLSVPFAIPRTGDASLVCEHRYGFEDPSCLDGDRAHHGARVELETATGGWSLLTPAAAYPLVIDSQCETSVDGQRAFGGSTGGSYERATFDLRAARGRRPRVRLREVTGCEDCGSGEGWFVDTVRVETTFLALEVLARGADEDGDGVLNETEIARGSDPQAADSDGDGLADGAEDLSGVFVSPEQAGTDPASPDSDGGGVPDGTEVELGSDPNDAADEPARASFPREFPAGGDRRWSLRADGSAGEASADPRAEVFSGEGGFRLLAAGAVFAFGEAYELDGAGGAVLMGPQRLGPLRVTRKVSAREGVLRYVDTFENGSAARAEGLIVLDSEFAPKRWVEIEETASGDREWSAADSHVHWNDRDPREGMPVTLWLHGGPGARAPASGARLEEGVARLAFAIALEPGERASLLHLGVQSVGLEESRAAAGALETAIESGAEITLAEEIEIANWSIDGDGDGIPGFFEARAGLDPRDPRDGGLDPDRDGLANAEEYRAGTDLQVADTDGDGLLDGKEVKELGTDARSTDSDRDGLADGGDPFPARRLQASFGPDRFGIAGGTVPFAIEIHEGSERVELPLRFTLRAEGARFEGPVEAGEVIRGLGTAEVLIAAPRGEARLSLAADVAGTATVRLVDSEGQGLLAPGEVFEDFEFTDGGFTEEGTVPAWKWGSPAGNPPGVVSGAKVWGTGLSGVYSPNVSGFLQTPEYDLSSQGSPALELRSFVAIEEEIDYCVIIARHDGGGELLAELSNSSGYESLAFDLRSLAGKKVRFTFLFFTDFSVEDLGWFIDDFRVRGLRTELRATFLVGNGDEDRDGLDNRAEVARGTNPRARDTDGDGLLDPVETGTGVFAGAADTGSDPTKPDSDGGGELDGEEVRRGGDPNDPQDDEQPIEFPDPFSTIEIRDGGGTPWAVDGLGTATWLSDTAAVFLGALDVDGFLFFSVEGQLSRRGQLLTLSGIAGPEGPPITRQLFVSPDSRLLRWLDIIENPAPQAATHRLLFQFAMAGPQLPEVVQTSSGDQVLDPGDESYIILLGGEMNPLFVGQAVSSMGADLKPEVLTFAGGLGSSLFNLPVPARGRAALLHFMAVSPKFEEVEELLALARRGGSDLLADLTPLDLSLVANFRIDSDGDGLGDGYELQNGLDPRDPGDAAADLDGDGLTNLAESALGTDPQKADTDADGWSDAEESRRGTDPLNPDTDADGVGNASDPLPLHAIAVRLEPLSLALAVTPTRWTVRFERADGGSLPDEALAADLTIAVRFAPPLDVVRVVAGTAAGAEPDGAGRWKPERDRLVLEVEAPGSGPVAVAIEDRLQQGIRGAAGSLEFFAPEEDNNADGLPNRFEVERGYNPRAADSDGDDIADRFETGSGAVVPALDAGTFPWEADSDGGGETDGNEARRGLDPFLAADDLRSAALPFRLGAAGTAWEFLPSWAVTGRTLGEPPLDNGAALHVNGLSVPYQTTVLASSSGETLRFGPAPVGGLQVSRLVRAAAGEDFVRLTDVFANPGAVPVAARVEITFDLSADAAASIAATSSGDLRLTRADRWVVFGGGQFRFLHVYFGGALVEVGREENDLLREVFSFEVPPGGTRALIHFLAPGRTVQLLADLASRLEDLGGGALDGIRPEHLEAAANLPPQRPVVWGRHPRGEVAAGGSIAFAGEFLGTAIAARAGARPLERILVTPARLLFKAPELPGRVALELVAAGSEVLFAEEVEVVAPAGFFRRGDADRSGVVDLADPIRILDYLFRAGGEPGCLDAADADDTGRVDVTDGILLLQALFQGTGAVPFPGGAVPGPDPSADPLGCGG